jgi:DNA-binding CsgD family transcriptional regulator
MDAVLEGAHSADDVAGLREGAGNALALIMDELAYGVMLVSPRGQIQHANQAARNELARRQVLAVHEGHVQTTDATQFKLLQQALAKAETGRRSLVALRSPVRKRISVAVVPLRSEFGHHACIALIFCRATVCDPVMLCFFARAHGLTPSEEQVLAILCQGHSAPQAARQLNVAVSTVRSHVRSMCAKTQSNGVRALVGQVAVLPPIGAAHLQAPLH